MDELNEMSAEEAAYRGSTPILTDQYQQGEVEEVEEDQGFLPDNPIELIKEAGKAALGGTADAVESVGSFAELAGDTFKTGVNRLYGSGTRDSQNPFSEGYVARDAGWLDIPDQLIPENNSGLGRLTRGLVEFGVLTAATGGVGGYTGAAAKTSTKLAAAARAAGMGRKGVKTIKFVHKGLVIGAEGAMADLISSSSEAANIANLVNEHAPWVPFSEALAVDPEKDGYWISRLKAIGAGAGVNLATWGMAGFIRGAWKGFKARKAGATVDEANAIGNRTMEESINRDASLDQEAATEMAANRFVEGRGVPHVNPREEYLRKYLNEEEIARYTDPATSAADRQGLETLAEKTGKDQGDAWDPSIGLSAKQSIQAPDPFVNPRRFNDSERSTFRPDSPDPLTSSVAESISDMKRGGPGQSSSPLFTESALKRLSGNKPELAKYIKNLSKDLARKVFSKDLESTLNFKDVQALIIKQADDMFGLIEGGGEEAAKNLANNFKKGKDWIEWVHDGDSIVSGTASQKMALQLVINSLTKQAFDIAQSTKGLQDTAPLTRQLEQINETLKVALTEHKKVGFMTGSELRFQKGDTISPSMRRQIEEGLNKIEVETNEFFDELDRLAKDGDWTLRRQLSEAYELSGGNVRTLQDMKRYLRAQITGGRLHGKSIPGHIRTELRSTFYNSILGAIKTPVKAITGTNLVATLRPFQAYLGSHLTGNKVDKTLAAVQINALGEAYAEGFRMFKHNWDLGVNRMPQTYMGRFDFEKDIQDFKALKEHYQQHGNAAEKVSYNFLNSVIDFNNNPWVRYSQNAMGAGDALARTIIGRMEMRMTAAKRAIESGIDLDNVEAWAKKYEENFREEIFKKGEYGEWVVSDKATRLAGDEAAMTKALEGNIAGFERIAQAFGMRAFFPFVRTGFNALNLAWQHTDGARLTNKWFDIMNGENLAKYGIKDKFDLQHQQSLMRGRVAMGRATIGMGFIAGMTGMMTGDWPVDKETRDLWKLNGIQPNSFKIGNVYISYKDIEPFNTIFAATANLAAYQHVLGEDMRDEWFEKLTWMAASVIVDKSMLSGVEDLAQVMSPRTSTGKASKLAATGLRARLPFSAISAQIGGIINSNEIEANSLWETIWQRDALAKSMLHPKYDVLSKDRSGTKPYTPPPGNPFLTLINSISPIAVTWVEDDPVKKGLQEMSFNLPEVMTTYKGVKLSSYERSQLQKYMQMTTLRAKLADMMRPNGSWRQDLNKYKAQGLRSSQGYKLYEQRFYADVSRVFSEAKNEAMDMLFTNNPRLAAQIELRLRQREISRTGDYDDVNYLINEFPR